MWSHNKHWILMPKSNHSQYVALDPEGLQDSCRDLQCPKCFLKNPNMLFGCFTTLIFAMKGNCWCLHTNRDQQVLWDHAGIVLCSSLPHIPGNVPYVAIKSLILLNLHPSVPTWLLYALCEKWEVPTRYLGTYINWMYISRRAQCSWAASWIIRFCFVFLFNGTLLLLKRTMNRKTKIIRTINIEQTFS